MSDPVDKRLLLQTKQHDLFSNQLPPVGLANAALAGEEMLGLEVGDVPVCLSPARGLAHAPLHLVMHFYGLVVLCLVLEARPLYGFGCAQRPAA